MGASERHGEQRLPPGPHGVPAEVVARNQRERLLAAMAEVCAEKGYVDTSVAAVAKRAGVSSVTFYEQFADRRDCMLAAHEHLSERLLEEIDRAAKDEPGAGAGVHRVLAVLAADPPSARLLSVEVLATGPWGAARHEALVEALAERLGATAAPGGGSLAPEAAWARAAGMLALVGRLAMAGEAERLPELEDELVEALGL